MIKKKTMKTQNFISSSTGFLNHLSSLKSMEIFVEDIFYGHLLGSSKVDGIFGTEIKKDHQIYMDLDQSLTLLNVYFHPDYFKQGRKVTNHKEKLKCIREEYGKLNKQDLEACVQQDLFVDEGIMFDLEEKGVKKISIKIKNLF